MKKYLGVIVAIIILAVLAFVWSDTTFKSVDSLMRPPKNEGQNSEIQAAFEACIDDKYILRSPLSGDYKSSFILVNLDADKYDEVVVFYSLSGSPDVARINVIDNVNNTWQSIGDLESAHKQVHKVDFSDVDNDGNKEIIVGWSIFDTELSNTLNVYKIKNENEKLEIEKTFESNYTEFTVCDVDSDNKSDILLFDKTHDNNSSIKAIYFDFSDGKADIVDEFFIDPIISSVHSVCFDKDMHSGNTRFYIDGYRIDRGMTTELFYWSNTDKRFKRPVYSTSKSITSAATRNTIITCNDVNDDGIIEIPFEEYISESEIVSSSKVVGKQQNIIKWMKCTDYGFSTVYFELFNSKSSYSLKIKNDWYGNFTVKNEIEKGLLTFYSLEKSGAYPSFDVQQRPNSNPNDENNSPLFSVLAIAENESNFYNLSKFKYLKNDNGFDYYCCIYDEGKNKGLTKEAIKKILTT